MFNSKRLLCLILVGSLLSSNATVAFAMESPGVFQLDSGVSVNSFVSSSPSLLATTDQYHYVDYPVEDGKKLAVAVMQGDFTLKGVYFSTDAGNWTSPEIVSSSDYQIVESYSYNGRTYKAVKLLNPKDGYYNVSITVSDGVLPSGDTEYGALVQYSSADKEAPSLTLTNMSFSSGESDVTLSITPNASDPSGIKSLEYATAPLSNPESYSIPFTATENNTKLTVPYLQNGMILYVRATDTNDNVKTTPVLVVNPTTEGEKLIQPTVTNQSSDGKITAVDVSFAFDPSSYMAATGTTVTFAKATSPAAEDTYNKIPETTAAKYTLTENGTYVFHLDFPMTKTVNISGQPTELKTTVHYKLQVPITAINTSDPEAEPPEISTRPVDPSEPGGNPSVEITTPTAGAEIYYKWISSNLAASVGADGFTKAEGTTVTIECPSLKSTAQVLVAYAEKDGVKSNISTQLFIDDEQMLELSPNPEATTWVKESRNVAAKVQNGGAYANSYATASAILFDTVPEYTVESQSYDSSSNPTYAVTANKEYTFAVGHSGYVMVTNPFDTGKTVKTSDTYSVTKSYTEEHIDFNAPLIPDIPEIDPSINGGVVDLSGVTDAESGLAEVGYYLDSNKEFVPPVGDDWDDESYPITSGNPTLNPFSKGQLVVFAKDNVGRIAYKVVTINGIELPEVSDAKDPPGWTNNDVDVTVTIKPKDGDAITNWTVKDGTPITQNPDGTGTINMTFDQNDSKQIILVGPGGEEVPYTVTVDNIDRVPPTFDEVTKSTEDPTRLEVNVDIKVSDNEGGSGLNDFTVESPASITHKDMETGEVRIQIPSNVTDLEMTVTDKAGNSTPQTITIDNIDTLMPELNVTPDKTTWTNQNVNLDITFSDNNGVVDVDVNTEAPGYVEGVVTVSGQDYGAGTASGVVTENTYVDIYAVDAAGNRTSKSLNINYIDKVKPTVSIERVGGDTPIDLAVNADDDASGIKTVEYAIVTSLDPEVIAGASWQNYTDEISVTYGPTSKYVVARSTDVAGNISDVTSYNLADFDKYVTVTTSPDKWVSGDVTITVDVDWEAYFADAGSATTKGQFSDATGATFGSVANAGSEDIATYAVDHNDKYAITISNIPDADGGTFSHEIVVDVDNIDRLAPAVSATNVGHYDSEGVWVLLTAQDIPTVAALPFKDVSGIAQAVVMPTANVPSEDVYAGVLSGTPVTFNGTNAAFVQFNSEDLQDYTLVVKDAAGNLAKIKLDIQRISGTPDVTSDPTGWTNQNVTVNATMTNPDASKFEDAFYMEDTVVDEDTLSKTVSQNGKYDVSVVLSLKDRTLYVQLPTANGVATNADQFAPDASAIRLPTISSEDAIVDFHDIDKYDWKLTTSMVIDNIDKTKPQIVVTDNAVDGMAGSEVTVTVKATDPVTNEEYPDASGIDYIEYQIGDKPPVRVSSGQTSFVVTTSADTTIHVADHAGNIETTVYQSTLDKEAPKLTYSTTPNQDVWTNSYVDIAVDITDNLSGIVDVSYPSQLKLKEAPSTANKLHHTYKFYAEENGTFNVTCTDKVGNTATYPIVINNIDTVAPTINSRMTPSGETYGNVTISIDAFDAQSGLKSVTTPDGKVQTPADGKLTYTASSNGDYEFIAIDNAGNTSNKIVVVSNIKVEISRPQDPNYETVDQSSNTYTRIVLDWTNKKQSFSPVAYPKDQIETYEYAVTKISDEDDSPSNPSWKTSRSAPKITVDREGIFSVQVRATNKAGTVSAITEYIVKQDFTDPTITKKTITNSYIKFTAVDKLSGIDYVECDCGNTADEDGYIKCTREDDEKTHKYTLVDLAGNKTTETLKIGDITSSSSNDDDDKDKVVSNKNENTSKPTTSGNTSGIPVNPPTGKVD